MWSYLIQNSPLSLLTQSVWRDEAYSILIAQKPLATYFQLSFEPPFYYTLLHFWIKVFGTSEIAVRCLSITGFVLAGIIVIKWAEKLFRTQWVSWYMPLLFLFNPMLLYYAFEARSYAWFMMFSVASCYFYFEKKWLGYTVSTVLGLYTHSYIIFVPIVQMLHYIFIDKHIKKIKFSSFFSDPFIQSVMWIVFLYLPWIYKMIIDIPRLSQSWYYPVDLRLLKSVLGNIFLGYEGTPWFLWPFTFWISILLFSISIISIITTHDKKKTWFFLLLLYIPLSCILLLSYVKPLFVMRYMIPSTIAEIFLISYMIDSIKSKLLQKITATVILLFCVAFSFWYTPNHMKPPIRSTISQINFLQRKNDVILVEDALLLYEAMYYNSSASPVLWYNPNNDSFPWYIGDYIIQKSQIVAHLPLYPVRGFLIRKDGTFEITYNSPMRKTQPDTVVKKK